MKKILPILLAAFAVFSVVQVVSAASLNLENIGTDDVTGKTFTSWTHYGLNPKLSGSATPSASVTVSIDGAQTATTSALNGDWQVEPTGLNSYGVYEVGISSSTENILFSLTLASASGAPKGGASTSTGSSATSLPVSGSSDMFIFAGLGLLFIAAAAASKYVFSWYE
jgi:hypothetical protein